MTRPDTTRCPSDPAPRTAGRRARLAGWARRGLVAVALAAGAGGLSAPAAFAAASKEIEPSEAPDGRLEGYATNVAYEKSSTVLTWFLFFFLVLVGVTALFRTAKRE